MDGKAITWYLASFMGLVIVVMARLWWVVPNRKTKAAKRTSAAKTLIVLGSGGHTSEMLTLVGSLDSARYTPRHYVLAETDGHSQDKTKQFEQNWDVTDTPGWHIHPIPRSREVGQSYITALCTTSIAFLASFRLVWAIRPDLVSYILFAFRYIR